MKQICNGWTANDYDGTPYHFEHIPKKEAELAKEMKECVHVVETINWTLADKSTVHLNKYFTFGLSRAIGLATQIEINSIEVAEDVVTIRLATTQEAKKWFAIKELFPKQRELAISDEEIQKAKISTQIKTAK